MTLQLQRKMNNRTQIYAADLYVLLQRELRRRQSPGCSTCYIQLPFRVDRQDKDASNWEVVTPPACPHGCKEIIEELLAQFELLYDLRPDDGRRQT